MKNLTKLMLRRAAQNRRIETELVCGGLVGS